MNAENFQCFSNEIYSLFGYDNYVVYAYQYTIFYVPYELWSGMPGYGPNTECPQSGIPSEYYGYGPQSDINQQWPGPEYYVYGPYENGTYSQNIEYGPQVDINQQWPGPEYYIYGPYQNIYENGPDSQNIGYRSQVDINQQWPGPEYYIYGPYQNIYENGPDSQIVGYGPQVDINQQWPGPEYYIYGPYQNIYENGPNSQNVGYGPQPDTNQHLPEIENFGNGPHSNLNEHWPAPEIINCGPQPDVTENWLTAEISVYEPLAELQQPSLPTQMLEHCPEPELLEDGKMPSILTEYEEPTEFPRYESAALNSVNAVEQNHFSSETIHQLQKVCGFQMQDSNQSEMTETCLDDNSSSECVNNSKKDFTKDKHNKLSENTITNSENEDTFSKFNATEESPSKNVPETPLSPAQITSIVNGSYTLRPLYRAFLELEENSLVCEVIYEEEELDYEDALSETDYSTESDTMSIEGDVPDTTNENKVSDDCTMYQNVIIVRGHLPVRQTCELVFISPTSSSVYVESDKSDLTTEMYEICDELPAENDKNLADEFSSVDNSTKIIEENLIKELSDTSEEISKNETVAIKLNENQFDLNIKVSKTNENAVGDEIGLEKFDEENHKQDEKDTNQILNKTDLEEIKYGGSECLAKPQTEKKGVTRCLDVFRRVLRRFGDLLFPCLRRKM
ncbi:uncharacterized protein LOC111638995 [Centruroides sculpturatus]|uniref:uncharacterized protein LOC111638995 n=1 Tax=Centruroides sculpturatus TaxID=218467 RepID=UPI000C6D697A|nr:uncharacterized protein LOC111638995 [Centruroides sculpturatus]